MKKIYIKHPALVCGVYYWLLRMDSSGILRWGLLAALCHEGGHILAWLLLFRRLPCLEISLGGISLRRKGECLSGRGELFLAMAGPGSNLLIGLSVLIFMELVRASYGGYYFACANLLLAGFNLLPLRPLDGYYFCLFCREKLHSFRK